MNEEKGYLYRCAHADGATLKQLVKDFVAVAPPCWSFGGAVLWDVEPAKGRENLRPVQEVTEPAALDISGDFGHAFSRQAEIRWKRREDGDYDLLLLTETALTPERADLFGGQLLLVFPVVLVPDERAADLLDTPRGEREQGIRHRLDRKEYRDEQLAVRFVRYVGLRRVKETPP